MAVQLSDATVKVNNEVVAIEPNTLKFTEGFGEQNVRAASVGGGAVEQIYSTNVESNFSKIMFELPVIPDNIDKARQWKSNANNNTVSIHGSTSEGKTISRSFSKAALLNDYEVELGSDTTIALEFTSNPAI